MEIFHIVIAIITIVAVIYFLVKKYETKLVLIVAGVFMALVALKPMGAFDAFAERMTTGGLIQAICSVLGFAAVLKITECDKHLIMLLSNMLKKAGLFLVPLATLLTFAINIALPSAAGCAAAVGAIFIPLLIYTGVKPAMAAAAVFAGTYGSMLSPGLSHNPFVAKLANVDVIQVINVHKVATISSVLMAAVLLGIIAIIMKENRGFTTDDKDFHIDEAFKANPLYALVNIVPLGILLIGYTSWGHFLKMGIPQAMLIGVFLAVIVTRKSPTDVSNGFFKGMGGAYAEILGIIIAAAVFVAGLQALGAIDAFNKALIANPSIAKIGATFGPMLLAIVTGSGDAAAFAFNEAVTPLAAQFGMSIEKMGSLAALSGAIGRSMSPIAGAVIICAGIAKVSTVDVVKRTAIPMIFAIIVVYFVLAL